MATLVEGAGLDSGMAMEMETGMVQVRWRRETGDVLADGCSAGNNGQGFSQHGQSKNYSDADFSRSSFGYGPGANDSSNRTNNSGFNNVGSNISGNSNNTSGNNNISGSYNNTKSKSFSIFGRR